MFSYTVASRSECLFTIPNHTSKYKKKYFIFTIMFVTNISQKIVINELNSMSLKEKVKIIRINLIYAHFMNCPYFCSPISPISSNLADLQLCLFLPYSTTSPTWCGLILSMSIQIYKFTNTTSPSLVRRNLVSIEAAFISVFK